VLTSAQVEEGITRMGATIIDSLDTLYLMGLTDELAIARRWVDTELTDELLNRPVTVRYPLIYPLIASLHTQCACMITEPSLHIHRHLPQVLCTIVSLSLSTQLHG